VRYFGILWILIFVAASHGSNLQEIIDEALPGDTVRVSSGTHVGNLTLKTRIVLFADPGAILRGTGQGSVVKIEADSCVVIGFRIEHCGDMLVDDDSGILVTSSHNLVQGNTLCDILFGVYLRAADSNTVAHNKIVGRENLSVGERGAGIHLWNSNRNTLTQNEISVCRDGFYIQNANHTHITENNVHDLRYGLHYMYADSNTFLNNLFHDNVAGAAVMYSHGITIRHNAFYRNRGFASYGILFQDCQGMTVDSNVIVDNVCGMFFEATRDNIFQHNIIARNDIALYMFQNSTCNVFYENNFFDNLSPLALVGKQSGSHWSFKQRGNYWGDYAGYDMDEDGIGDVPHRILNVFEYLEGNLPNARLYLYSPASQAIAASSRAFPILETSQEADSHVLIRPAALNSLPILANLEAALNDGRQAKSDHRVIPLLIFLVATAALVWARLSFRRAV